MNEVKLSLLCDGEKLAEAFKGLNKDEDPLQRVLEASFKNVVGPQNGIPNYPCQVNIKIRTHKN